MLTWIGGIEGTRNRTQLASYQRGLVIMASIRFKVRNNYRESSNYCDAPLVKNTHLKDLVSLGDLFSDRVIFWRELFFYP